MSTVFNVGDCVKSLVTAQGLIEGHKYTVEKVLCTDTAFGTFVTYRVSRRKVCEKPLALYPAQKCGAGGALCSDCAETRELDVVNGHVVFDAVRS